MSPSLFVVSDLHITAVFIEKDGSRLPLYPSFVYLRATIPVRRPPSSCNRAQARTVAHVMACCEIGRTRSQYQ